MRTFFETGTFLHFSDFGPLERDSVQANSATRTSLYPRRALQLQSEWGGGYFGGSSITGGVVLNIWLEVTIYFHHYVVLLNPPPPSPEKPFYLWTIQLHIFWSPSLQYCSSGLGRGVLHYSTAPRVWGGGVHSLLTIYYSSAAPVLPSITLSFQSPSCCVRFSIASGRCGPSHCVRCFIWLRYAWLLIYSPLRIFVFAVCTRPSD